MTALRSTIRALERNTLPEWYDGEQGRLEIAALQAWLVDTCQVTDPREIAYVTEKPWKYSAEREQMIRERGRVVAS